MNDGGILAHEPAAVVEVLESVYRCKRNVKEIGTRMIGLTLLAGYSIARRRLGLVHLLEVCILHEKLVDRA